MDSLGEFKQGLDRQLDQHRPARVGPKEYDWREPVYAWARNHMPDETHALRNLAKLYVDQREGLATRHANKLLRVWLHGQAPLDWSIVGPLPITANGLRIRLDDATPDDIEDAARELEAAGKATFDEVVLLANGMRDLARSARRSGYKRIIQLGNLDPADGDPSFPDDLDDEEEPW